MSDLSKEEIDGFRTVQAMVQKLPAGAVRTTLQYLQVCAGITPSLFDSVVNLKMDSPEDAEIYGLTLGQVRSAITFAKSRGWKP